MATDDGESWANPPARHLADDSGLDDPRDIDTARSEPISAHLATPALEAVEPLQTAAQDSPFAASSDQSLMVLASQQAAVPVQTSAIDALVANALEGPTVDLDALLGPQRPSPDFGGLLNITPDVGDPFGASGFFMPDLAQQQIAAQLEQVAATGHA
jgi:hypothetical protein